MINERVRYRTGLFHFNHDFAFVVELIFYKNNIIFRVVASILSI